MKPTVLTIAILISLLLVACASPSASQTPTEPSRPAASTPTPAETPQPTVEPTQPGASPTATPFPTELQPAQQAAIQALVHALGIAPSLVKVVAAEGVNWPNGCLGVQPIGVMCTQQIVTGYRIILEANGQQYEYHTNQTGSQVVPAKDEQPVPVSNDAVQAAIHELADGLEISPDQVSLASAVSIEWPDSCLGIQQTNIGCTDIVTPGYLIVLTAQGHLYEYHTDASGIQVIPATLGLSWSRQGGIAGFCDQLQIYLPDRASASSCKPAGIAGAASLTKLVSANEMDQFNQWLDEFGSLSLTQKDPAVTDAMTQTLVLQGYGQGQPDPAQQQAMFTWAQMVFGRMHP